MGCGRILLGRSRVMLGRKFMAGLSFGCLCDMVRVTGCCGITGLVKRGLEVQQLPGVCASASVNWDLGGS